MRQLLIGLTACIVFQASGKAEACSAFKIHGKQEVFVGKSFDWGYGFGHMIVNKRNQQKEALTFFPQDRAAQWVSKYGSVTFNQWGREFPLGGMNEKGLVVEILLLGSTEYPAPDARPAVNELQWIQYQLDNFSTTRDVIEHVNDIRISAVSERVHYFICDASGDCGVFEYLDGEMVVSGPDSPWPAITNMTYQNSIEALSYYEGFGGTEKIDYDTGFIGRFVTLASRIKDYPGQQPLDYTKETLRLVKDGSFSKWNIVYQTKSQKLHFKMASAGSSERSINFNEINFSCKKPSLVMDLEANISGKADSKFKKYNHSKNEELVRRTARRDRSVPDLVVNAAVNYPRTITCTE